MLTFTSLWVTSAQFSNHLHLHPGLGLQSKPVVVFSQYECVGHWIAVDSGQTCMDVQGPPLGGLRNPAEIENRSIGDRGHWTDYRECVFLLLLYSEKVFFKTLCSNANKVAWCMSAASTMGWNVRDTLCIFYPLTILHSWFIRYFNSLTISHIWRDK